MIEMDVYVPVIEETFDIRADEGNTAAVFLEEVLALLSVKTGDEGNGREKGFALFSRQTQKKLRPDLTLRQQGIRSGSSLILL